MQFVFGSMCRKIVFFDDDVWSYRLYVGSTVFLRSLLTVT